MKTNLQILKEAKSLIENPDNYCTNYFAENQNGLPTKIHGNDACSFCSRGAIIRASNDLSIEIDEAYCVASSFVFIEAEFILHKAALEIIEEEYSDIFIRDLYYYDVSDTPAAMINNHIGHEGAMKVFDRAIEMAKRIVYF